ncbi:MAG TPA: hypothetical protein VF857_07315 [Spirochaetota bacterium]
MKSFSLLSSLILFATVIFFTAYNVGAQGKSYKIGDRGPGGGYVFYDKGSTSDGWQYLEAAPEDLSDGIGWYNHSFVETAATETAIGTGKVNTKKIILAQGEGNYAAILCVRYTGGGQSDWFLPSKDELCVMLTNLEKAGTGGLSGTNYWSSTENSEYVVWIKSFACGNRASSLSDDLSRKRVRAVRSF